MKKKLLALVSSVLAITATVGTITAFSSDEVKADGTAITFDSCVDIASDSWVSSGNGWRAGRYGGRSIDSTTLGVTLGAYSWDGSAHWLVWGGGGFSTSDGLYTGGDFAVSFAAEVTSGGFAIVIDQFSIWVKQDVIKIGYDEQCGAFGDAMLDYAPAYWTTDLDILHGRGADVAQWFVQESVSLTGVVDVDAFVTTTDGVTSLGVKVDDKVVTATTERTRVTGVHAGIMSQNGKVYSQKATEYVASMDKAVASLDESVYTGEFKTQVDTAVANAKSAMFAQETLTSAFINEQVGSVLALINEKKINAMFDSCVDIASDSWLSNGCGWRINRYWGASISSETISATIDAYSGNPGANALIWMGGGPAAEGVGNLYKGGDFAVSFAGDVGGSPSGLGFAVVVDQFSIWVSTTAIKIGYDLQAGTFGDSMNDYAPQQWTTDLDILHDRGSEAAQWFVQESVNLTGVVDIDAFVTTTDGVTMLGVKVGDTVVTATTEMARVTGLHTAIVSWGGTVYSQKATGAVASIENAVKALDETVYTGEVKTQIDAVVLAAKEAIWGEESLTNTFATEVSAKALRLIGIYASGALNTVAQWNATKDIVRFVSSIDSLDYEAAGFEITYNGQTVNVSITKVYTSFQYGDTVVTPEDWNVAEGYLFAFTIREVPATATFTVRAYWELEDGTVVYGTTTTVNASENA